MVHHLSRSMLISALGLALTVSARTWKCKKGHITVVEGTSFMAPKCSDKGCNQKANIQVNEDNQEQRTPKGPTYNPLQFYSRKKLKKAKYIKEKNSETLTWEIVKEEFQNLELNGGWETNIACLGEVHDEFYKLIFTHINKETINIKTRKDFKNELTNERFNKVVSPIVMKVSEFVDEWDNYLTEWTDMNGMNYNFDKERFAAALCNQKGKLTSELRDTFNKYSMRRFAKYAQKLGLEPEAPQGKRRLITKLIAAENRFA